MKLLERVKQILSLERNKKNENNNDGESSGEVSAYGKKLKITEVDKKKRVSILTPREYELYLLLVDGFTLKESAEQLSIKYSTANTHMTGIYKKLGVNSRAELIINYRHMNEINKK